MLINLSNHPSAQWSPEQLSIAKKLYGKISDLAFPAIDPHWDSAAVKLLAENYLLKIKELLTESEDELNAVHIVGEYTFSFRLVELLKKNNISAVCSTTLRISAENNGIKTSQFRFIQFREY